MNNPRNSSAPASNRNELFSPVRFLFKYARETFTPEENASKLSNGFLTCLCLVLGVVSNIKLEVATYSGMELENDLVYVLMSNKDTLYLDDVDFSAVRWNLEIADALAILLSSFFVWHSSVLRSPLSEYALLPWLGLTLRGLLARQAVSALSLAYVFAAAEGKVRMIFSTVYAALFLVQVRIWLQVGRLVISRWNTHRAQLHQVKKEIYVDHDAEIHASKRDAPRAVKTMQR